MVRKLKTNNGKYNMTSWARGFGPYTQPGAYGENVFGTNILSGLLNPQQANQPANGNVGMNTAMAPDMSRGTEPWRQFIREQPTLGGGYRDAMVNPGPYGLNPSTLQPMAPLTIEEEIEGRKHMMGAPYPIKPGLLTSRGDEGGDEGGDERGDEWGRGVYQPMNPDNRVYMDSLMQLMSRM